MVLSFLFCVWVFCSSAIVSWSINTKYNQWCSCKLESFYLQLWFSQYWGGFLGWRCRLWYFHWLSIYPLLEIVGSDLVCSTRPILWWWFTSFIIFRQLEVHTETYLGTRSGFIVVHKNTFKFRFGGLIYYTRGRSTWGRLMFSSN